MSGRILRGLLADLGGTNARFAVGEVSPNGEVAIAEPVGLLARDFPTADAAVRAYLERFPAGRLDFAAVACAGPVKAGRVSLTNLGWSLSETRLAAALRLENVCLLNDLAAVAWAAPAITNGDLRPVGAVRRRSGVIAVLGAGTGSNCSAHIPCEAAQGVVLVGEAGHIGFAPRDEPEVEIWRRLQTRFGRVSVERLTSGPGVLNIYQALCAIAGLSPACDTPEGVSTLADSGDAVAGHALDHFARILGGLAGDCALAFGAQSVYLAGGLAPHLLTGERALAFRGRFEDKGRFQAQMARVGAFVILHPHAALIGAARAATVVGSRPC